MRGDKETSRLANRAMRQSMAWGTGSVHSPFLLKVDDSLSVYSRRLDQNLRSEAIHRHSPFPTPCTYFFHRLFQCSLGTLLYILREIQHLIIVFLRRRKEHNLEFAFHTFLIRILLLKIALRMDPYSFIKLALGTHKDKWDPPCLPEAHNLVSPVGEEK